MVAFAPVAARANPATVRAANRRIAAWCVIFFPVSLILSGYPAYLYQEVANPDTFNWWGFKHKSRQIN
ncbi:MAG: hypothetical protein AMXMBFR82_44400 [Candidatus Hydrogenedentota bacterium]